MKYTLIFLFYTVTIQALHTNFIPVENKGIVQNECIAKFLKELTEKTILLIYENFDLYPMHLLRNFTVIIINKRNLSSVTLEKFNTVIMDLDSFQEYRNILGKHENNHYIK